MGTETETPDAYERPSVVSLGSIAARTEVTIDEGSIIEGPSDRALKDDVVAVDGAVARLRRLSSR